MKLARAFVTLALTASLLLGVSFTSFEGLFHIAGIGNIFASKFAVETSALIFSADLSDLEKFEGSDSPGASELLEKAKQRSGTACVFKSVERLPGSAHLLQIASLFIRAP